MKMIICLSTQLPERDMVQQCIRLDGAMIHTQVVIKIHYHAFVNVCVEWKTRIIQSINTGRALPARELWPTASTKGVLKSQVAGGSSQFIQDGILHCILPTFCNTFQVLLIFRSLPNISLFFRKPCCWYCQSCVATLPGKHYTDTATSPQTLHS